MPLIKGKSDKAFSKNVETEMKAGKPQKQALAIAYATKRRSKKAKGGIISAQEEKRPNPAQETNDSMETSRVSEKGQRGPGFHNPAPLQGDRSQSRRPGSIEARAASSRPSINSARTTEDMRMKGMSSDPMDIDSDHDEDMMDARFAEGGEVEDHYDSIADAILAKKRRAQAAKDTSDLEQNAEESNNVEDQQSFDALRKENYSESEGLSELDSPSDSNEHSPEHEEEDVNDDDIVSSIRRKAKKSVR